MSELEEPARTEVSAAGPFEVLHLLPAAPHDLVVEVYWHLVRQLRAAAGRDPQENRAVAAVTEAYELLCAAAVREGIDREPVALAVSAARRRLPLGRLESTSAPSRRAPSEILWVLPDAPPDVIELAYEFLRQRARGEHGASSPALDELRRARDTMLGRGTDRQADLTMESDLERPSEPVVETPARSLSRSGDVAKRLAGHGWRLTVATGLIVVRGARHLAHICWRLTKRYAPPMWRWARTQTAALAKTVARVVAAAWRLALRSVRDWAAQRLREEPTPSDFRSANDSSGAILTPDPRLEERMAAIGATLSDTLPPAIKMKPRGPQRNA